MNTVSAMMCKSKYVSADHPVLAIDGVPVQLWISAQMFDDPSNGGAEGLVPAQGWLLDDDHLQIAWKLLEPADEGSTVVPLLICPDDMDLNCTVVVVEQSTDAESIVWKRFGWATDSVNGMITAVRWSGSEQSARFERRQFYDSVQELKRLTNDVWGPSEQTSTLLFEAADTQKITPWLRRTSRQVRHWMKG